jgi:simple sugar transport system permease protein
MDHYEEIIMIIIQLLPSIIAGGIALAVSILFVSIGEVYNERAGVINLGLEATISLTAFVGLWVTFETGNFFLGILAAIFMGAGIGLIHSFTCVRMRVNQLIAGLLILTLADGLANFLNSVVVAGMRQKMIEDPLAYTTAVPTVTPLPSIYIPFLSDIPVLGEILFQHNIFVYLSYFLAIVFGLILYKTTWGLKIRAVGENPEACDAAGINVNLIRHLCVIFSGAMAGLAGASISLGFIGLYDSGIAGGRGWIAIIVVIFSRWNPYKAILGSLIFGMGYSVAANLIGVGSGISYYFLLTMPYLLALIVIVLVVGTTKGPSALTVPYWRK